MARLKQLWRKIETRWVATLAVVTPAPIWQHEIVKGFHR